MSITAARSRTATSFGTFPPFQTTRLPHSRLTDFAPPLQLLPTPVTLSSTKRIAIALVTIGAASLSPSLASAQQTDSIAQRDSIARRDSVLRAGAVTRDSIHRLSPVEVQASIL